MLNNTPNNDLDFITDIRLVKDQPLLCPHCQKKFMGYRNINKPITDAYIVKSTKNASGEAIMRSTCGNIACYHMEERFYINTSPWFKRMQESSIAHANAKAPGISKSNSMQGLLEFRNDKK